VADLLRLCFADFPGEFNPTRILRLLRRRFAVEIDTVRPDWVLFSVFGHNYLQYADAVRIFFTGENVHPDFNLCDYAFGFDWLEFGDRYYRCPNYQLYEHYHEIRLRRRSRLTREDLAGKSGFCNFIYTNGSVHPFRDEFFRALSAYRRVDSAGAHLNNVGFTPGVAYTGDWPGDKVAFQKRYKFTIAFENSSTPGYTTEKIVHALAADTIPIYFGNPLVGREFNSQRFINCHDFPDPEAVIARIAEIDQNDEQYLAMVNGPFFRGDEPLLSLSEEAVLDHFALIFGQTKTAAYRRNFHVWGPIYEQRRIREVNAERRAAELQQALEAAGRPAVT
jgi:hypothetical protein